MARSNGARRRHRVSGGIAIALTLALALSACGGGGADDDDDDASGPDPTSEDGDAPANPDLPVIYQEAEAAGTLDDYEWGEQCDPDTGRLMVPMQNAFPCVEPYDEAAGNGGATAPGVTEDEILIALYKGQPDQLQQLLVEDAGAQTDPTKVNETAINYLKMFEEIGETWGRTLNIVTVEATGGPADETAAAADAQTIIDMGAFAAVGGPGQTDVYWQALTEAGILCVGACSVAVTQARVNEVAPYLWATGPNPEQADSALLELVGKQLVGKPAEFAGDPELQNQERVFGWIQAERFTGEFSDRIEAFDEQFADEYGGEIAHRVTYFFDPARGAEIATNAIAQMKEAGVTTVIVSTDPLVPKNITEEATKNNYFPEWVVGPSVLADTTLFGRTFDQTQWAHAFGLGLPAARQEHELEDSYLVYNWYYGEPPLVNTDPVIMPGPYRLLLGIHLAGPNLTPETFRDGLFRYPPQEQKLTSVHQSWGTELWPEADYNTTDDFTTWWWDSEATGEDEAGNEGTGMMAYVEGGKRYLPGDWPTDPIPWFVPEGAVTVYDAAPPGDEVPDYPAWPGSPAAG